MFDHVILLHWPLTWLPFLFWLVLAFALGNLFFRATSRRGYGITDALAGGMGPMISGITLASALMIVAIWSLGTAGIEFGFACDSDATIGVTIGAPSKPC